jgi:hypothetical protein
MSPSRLQHNSVSLRHYALWPETTRHWLVRHLVFQLHPLHNRDYRRKNGGQPFLLDRHYQSQESQIDLVDLLNLHGLLRLLLV